MPRAGHAIVLAAFTLLCIGVLMVSSAIMSVDPKQAVTIQSLLTSRSTIYMVLAMVAMLACAALPVGQLASRPNATAWIPWLAPVILVCLLTVYVPGLGHEVNGSRRWIKVPGVGDLTMQPSEIAKWGLVLLVAWHAARRGPAMGKFWTGLLPALIVVGLISGLVAHEDLGTALLIASTACVLLVAAGAKIWHFAMMVPFGALGLAAALITNPYRITRLTTFLNPYAHPEKEGYHMIQSLVAVSNGEVFGRGLGFGLQKFGYLPEDHTDFLFAVICEELGVAGAAVVVALYIMLLWAGWAVVRKQPSPFLKLLALGIVTTLGIQALINLFVVTGMAPTKGIALPLLSSGGTGWILTAASLGLLVAIDRACPTHADEPGFTPALAA
ncbi:MAG: cell division protein FtsW [Phycisphaerales bacterium]|nr:cell division protein FtsW [Phycisphaerales bacterium]